MEIIDISEKYEGTYCKCLEDWSEEMRGSGDYKKEWFDKKKAQGLRVKLAKDEKGEIVGMIHYAPIEKAPALGKDLYYIYCIWVHGYKQGVGNRQGRGVGTMLLEAAENDAMALGAKGMVAWGLILPFFIRSKWFKKRGYVRADRDGMMEMVWKSFTEGTEAPRLIKRIKKPVKQHDIVEVTCFRNGWCPGQNLACDNMKKLVTEYGDKIRFTEIDTDKRENLIEWGIADAIFINDKQVVGGPPPKYEALKKMIEKRMKRVKR
jgi:N-acetylglutamate synthase-like GNAT family acetyltransferase